MQPPAPPRFASTAEYGATLSDAAFWAPYAAAVLARHGYADADLTAGFAGTYPTLLAGEVVVKLFGHFPGWQQSVATELAVNRLVQDHPAVGAPQVLATGNLYPAAYLDTWPYLIVQRLRGVAWRDAALAPAQRASVARSVGAALRAVHGIDASGTTGLLPDWVATAGRHAADRHRAWGTLPDRLVEHIDGYLTAYRSPEKALVHADVTEDHIFTADGRLTGIIDWGDAMVTDPFYDLAALHLGAFGGDRALLAAALDGYGWPVERDFARHALQVALMHRFDVFAGVAGEIAAATSLDDLAGRLFGLG